MSNANLGSTPYHTVVDTNGIPVAGAKIYTYSAGTEDEKDTYTDYDSEIAQTNPIIADSAGRFELWLGGGLYKITYKDSDDTEIRTVDNVGTGSGGPNAVMTVQTVVGDSASLKSLSEAVAGSVITLGYRTVGDGGGGLFKWVDGATGGDDGITVDGNDTYTSGRWVRDITNEINPKYWGAYGNNSDDDKDYIESAVDYATLNGLSMFFPEGTYYISSDTTFNTVPITFDGKAKIRFTNFSPSMNAIIDINDSEQHFDVVSGNVPAFPGGTIVSPSTFGSTRDGVADDVDAIDLAIESVATNGGTVLMPDGTYAVSEPVELKSKVNIKGTGIGSIIKPRAAASLDSLISGTSVTDINISNVNLAGVYSIPSKGIALTGVEDVVIEDCRISEHAKSGIVANGTDITIRNNRLLKNGSDTTDYCIYHETGDNLLVEGNYMTAAATDVGTDNVLGCLKVINGTGHTIRNNRADRGMYFAAGSEYNVENNTVDCTGDGIDASNMTTGVISYNTVIGTTAGYRGITIDSVSGAMTISQNTFFGTDATGIYETNSPGEISYGVNIFHGCADWYDVADATRWNTLGTALWTELDGDTTNLGDLRVTGNMAVDGDISFGNLSAGNLTSTGDVTSATGNFVAVEGGLSLGLLGDALKIAHNSIVQASGTGPFTADTTGCVGSIGIPNVASNEGTGSNRYLTMRNPILKTDSWVQVTSHIGDVDYVASTSTWTVQPSSLVDGTMTFYVFQYNGSNAATDMTANYMIINQG